MAEYGSYFPQEVEGCEPMTILGVECFALKHSLPAPFISTTNNSQMIDFMNSHKGPTVVTFDGFNTADYQDWKYLEGVKPSIAFYPDTQELWKIAQITDTSWYLVIFMPIFS